VQLHVFPQLPSDLDLHWTSRRVRGVPGRSDTQRRGEFRSDAAALQKLQQHMYTLCPEKGTNNILDVTLTNLYNFS